MPATNLIQRLSTFNGHWQPRTVAEFNDMDIMVVKAAGEFVWHQHDETDDFFYVIKGDLEIQMPGESVRLGPGDLYIVPRGVQHRPVAHGEVHMLLIEPRGTPNTGDKLTAAERQVI